MYIPEGCAYSLLFPVKDVKHQEEITRDFLEGPEAQDKVTRLALLNIWNHIDLTEFSDWKQTEPEVEFFASSRSNETLPDEDFEANELPKDRKIKGQVCLSLLLLIIDRSHYFEKFLIFRCLKFICLQLGLK